MESLDQQSRRVATTLVRESTDWGESVSEKRGRTFWLNAVLLVLSVFVLFCGAVIILPLLAGLLLSAEITEIGSLTMIVVAFIGLAIFFNIQSRKGRGTRWSSTAMRASCVSASRTVTELSSANGSFR